MKIVDTELRQDLIQEFKTQIIEFTKKQLEAFEQLEIVPIVEICIELKDGKNTEPRIEYSLCPSDREKCSDEIYFKHFNQLIDAEREEEILDALLKRREMYTPEEHKEILMDCILSLQLASDSYLVYYKELEDDTRVELSRVVLK